MHMIFQNALDVYVYFIIVTWKRLVHILWCFIEVEIFVFADFLTVLTVLNLIQINIYSIEIKHSLFRD